MDPNENPQPASGGPFPTGPADQSTPSAPAFPTAQPVNEVNAPQPTPGISPDTMPPIISQDPSLGPLFAADSAEEPLDSNEPSLIKTFIEGLFSWFIIPIGIVLVLHLFVFQAFHVVGSSMIPTLHDADYLIISKLGQTAAMAQSAVGKETDYVPPRNEIIVFRFPKEPSLIFVKRVIALPGERVVISNGQVRVYNKEKPQGFDPTIGYEVSSPVTLTDTDVTVPPHHVFVLGDNRMPNGSSDSRDWGTLPTDHIIGNAVARLIPIDKARVF